MLDDSESEEGATVHASFRVSLKLSPGDLTGGAVTGKNAVALTQAGVPATQS